MILLFSWMPAFSLSASKNIFSASSKNGKNEFHEMEVHEEIEDTQTSQENTEWPGRASRNENVDVPASASRNLSVEYHSTFLFYQRFRSAKEFYPGRGALLRTGDCLLWLCHR